MSNDVKTVGELLKAAREERGLSIESIAKDICVRSSYLVAIEADDYSGLPEKTFAIGFVRAYAMSLKQDAKAIVSQFKEEFGCDEAAVSIPIDMAIAAPKRRLPGWLSPFAGVLGVSLCWAFFGSSIVPFSLTADSEVIDRNTDVAQLQAVQASLPQEFPVASDSAVGGEEVSTVSLEADLPSEQVGDSKFLGSTSLFSPAAIADQNVGTNSGRSDFLLQATEDAWLRLENVDGTEIWSGVLREGQSYRPQFDGAALLSTTNAGAVTVSVGAQQFAALGARGEVVEDLKLDGDRLFSAVSAASSGATGSR